jgi:hypothetical protein
VANENKFDSGTPHVVIDVQHPSGETHSIAVPADEKIADFHQALLDADTNIPQFQIKRRDQKRRTHSNLANASRPTLPKPGEASHQAWYQKKPDTTSTSLVEVEQLKPMMHERERHRTLR